VAAKILAKGMDIYLEAGRILSRGFNADEPGLQIETALKIQTDFTEVTLWVLLCG
jgi:hypothetical protein